MGQATQPFKRSLSGSVGSGIGSLFNASGKRYYILEHRVSSRYHKAGESQEIIVDEIMIGRDPQCQVRYDDSFQTVSRRHAAIVKSGDQWKLVQLSKTNSTFLNGRKVDREWYLQNGDEIQVSVNGPKLGFIVPTGKNATVNSIGLSRRLSLFRQQALRPYKRAITALSVVLALTIAGSVSWNIYREAEYGKMIAILETKIVDAIIKNKEIQEQHDSIVKIQAEQQKRIGRGIAVPAGLETLVDKCKDDIYYLYVDDVYITDGSHKTPVSYSGGQYGWSGTGFLLDDGRFVTARHCVQAWMYESDFDVLAALSVSQADPELTLEATIHAVSRSGNKFTFKSSQFVCDNQYDTRGDIGMDDNGNPISITMAWSPYFDSHPMVMSTDWTYVSTKEKGKISADAALSSNLKTGTELVTLGFPKRIGVGDTPSAISPAFNKFNAGFDGLDNCNCILHTRGTDHGNSGGPVFARKDNKLVVIGIVSRGAQSEEYGYAVPVSALK